MLSRRTLLATAAAGAVTVSLPAGAQDLPSIVIEVIVDNGGTVRAADAQDLITNVLAVLANLHGRDFRGARIDLILTSHPTTVWSGNPRDLMRQADTVLDLVRINDRCSDIERAFRQADQNLRIAAPAEAHLVIVSPLIAAPFPCNQGPAITLPQPVPPGMALGQMAADRHLRTLRFFGVHPSQERPWSDYLEAEGILARSHEGQIDFTFLGRQKSLSFIQPGRVLIRRREH